MLNPKVKILKARLRKAYKDYHNHLNNFSCGGNLAEFISPDLERKKIRVNYLLDELAKIDPNTPKSRLGASHE